jgi:hypothetical protein
LIKNDRLTGDLRDQGHGELDRFSPPASQGQIILTHTLDLRDGQRFDALRIALIESEGAEEGKWIASLYITGSHGSDSNFVAGVSQGPHIAIEIHYDDALSQASFMYDIDINDNVSALTFGPFDYTGTFMETHETRLTFSSIAAGDANGLLENWSIMQRPDSRGDFNGNGALDAVDIELLSAAVRSAANDVAFDLNSDQLVDELDRTVWVESLRRTYFGDSNLDGEFSSADLVTIFQAGQYEDAMDGNSVLASGDWNGDADFNSRDLVLAFQAGGYEIGPRAAVVTIPEPTCGFPLLLAPLAVGKTIRNQRTRTRDIRSLHKR